MAGRIREIGVPVRSVNWVRLFPVRDRRGRDALAAVMGQQAENLFVLLIDPGTGDSAQYVAPAPGSNYPTAALRSRDGALYIGAAYSGHLLRFRPEEPSIEDLGAINPPDDTFPCRIDEDADGVLWIGCYGSAGLTAYDPKTSSFTRYGRMDEQDMYCYPLAAPDGKIACEIRVTHPHIVVFDPETGTRRTAGPRLSKEEGGFASLVRAADGALYIHSSAGCFRLEGFDAVPVEALPDPEPAPALSDGAVATFADASSQQYRTVAITHPSGRVRHIELDYTAAGSALFLLHRGPDDALYGSSILPLHLFRYTPQDGRLVDLGVCSTSTGEAYSMGNLDGKLYICAYPAARLSVYDPSRPYRFGTEADSNPREIGRMDEVSYRPRSMLTGPKGRVWTASVPDYGRWGGPLSWYDPHTNTFGTCRTLAGEASCWTLAWLEAQRLIAVGTTISGGTGTRPRVDRAELLLWDYEQEETVWAGTLDRPVHTIGALVCGCDGRLYGTAAGEETAVLFVFDPESRTFIEQVPLPEGAPLDLGLRNGPDGRLYVFTRPCLYRFDPVTARLTAFVRDGHTFDVAGPIIGDTIYFARLHTLCGVEIE